MIKPKKILVICPAPLGGSPAQRFKYEQYFPHLEEHGYQFTISSFQSERFNRIIYRKGKFLEKSLWTIYGHFKRYFDLIRSPFYDGIFIFLWVTPLGLPILETLFSKLNSKIIYDIDDMIHLGDTSESNRIISKLKGRKKPIVLIKNASHVIVCTPTLENFAKSLGQKNVTDISSTFNTDRFSQKKIYNKSKPVCLGWTGSHSTLKFLKEIESVLEKVAKLRQVKLIVIADKPIAFRNIETEFIKWNEDTEVKDLQKIDIGLYPLPLADWVLGKSGLKALNYMSVGTPAVATKIGANTRVIENETTGYLVENENEWVDALLKLIDDSTLREEMGRNGRKRVINFFSVESNKPKYISIFDRVYGKN